MSAVFQVKDISICFVNNQAGANLYDCICKARRGIQIKLSDCIDCKFLSQVLFCIKAQLFYSLMKKFEDLSFFSLQNENVNTLRSGKESSHLAYPKSDGIYNGKLINRCG